MIQSNSRIDSSISQIFCAKELNAIRETMTEEKSETEVRGEFERDRDRILYSRAFRRLSGKTQVFMNLDDDHLRNRLSHTLEVAQISRTVTRALGLNEQLAEAIALGHDIGHTPFGHIGERTLNYIMNGCDIYKDFNQNIIYKGFKHNWQSVRVVTNLEYYKKGVDGLNLTMYTLWGILNHSNIESKECGYFYKNEEKKDICTLRHSGEVCHNEKKKLELNFYTERYGKINNNKYVTIEGLIVAIADEIAQRHHDVEDAMIAKIIDPNELVEKINDYYGEFFPGDVDKSRINEIKNVKNDDLKWSMLSSFLVNVITENLIKNLIITINSYKDLYNIKNSDEFEEKKSNEKFIQILKKDINFRDKFIEKDELFKKYIQYRVINSYKAQCMDGRGDFVIRKLFRAYLLNPQQLPDTTIIHLFENLHQVNSINYIQDYSNIKEYVGELRNKLYELHKQNNNEYKEILMRTICDYISGMTDKYALKEYSKLY